MKGKFRKRSNTEDSHEAEQLRPSRDEIFETSVALIDLPEEVRIWTGKTAPGRSLTLAYDHELEAFVGYVVASQKRAASSECRQDLRSLADEYDVSEVFADTIRQSWVDPDYRGLGVGVALYVGAAIQAAERGLAIMAEECDGGGTTDDAKRVWRSRDFRKHVAVSGLAAVFRGLKK